MSDIATKLTYLADTKDLFKDRLNSLGAEITSSTTFRNYLTWLDTFYGEVSDKTDLSQNGVVGRTSQESTTGKNLNIFPYGTGGNGNGITFTINNDGTVVLNGKNNGNGNSARLFYNNVENPMVLEAGRYYMIPPNNTNIVYVMTDGTNYYSFNNNNGYSQLFNSNLSVKQFYVQVAKNNTTTFTNEKIYPMLSTTQVTQSDWEEYTGKQPGPNPNYPQPINNLSGDVAYKVSGKNLLNKANGTYESWVSINITDLIEDGVNYYVSIDYKNLIGSCVIRIDYTYNGTINYIWGDGGSTGDVTEGTMYKQFNIPNHDVNTTIYLRVKDNGTGLTSGYYSNWLLAKSDTATNYEPYIEPQTFNIPLKSKNLFDKNTTNKLNGYFERSGDTIHSSGANRVFYLECKPNTTYAFTQGETNISNHVFQVASTIEKPDIDVAVENFADRSSYNPYKTFTYTTNANAKYLVIRLRSADTTNEFLDGVQIEENNEVTPYEPYYDIELCDIDTYEDKIYSSNGRFYLNKNIGKVTLNGSENWIYTSGLGTTYSTIQQNFDYGSNNTYYANYFLYGSNDNKITLGTSGSTKTMYMKLLNSITNVTSSDTTSTIVEKIKSWLSTHNTIVYYVLATPTTTEITQENYPSLYNALKQIQDYLTAYKINKEFILGYSSPEIEY